MPAPSTCSTWPASRISTSSSAAAITESAYSGKATPETFFGRVVQEFGADRIAWGSNFPAAEDSLADIVKALKAYIAFLPAADQHWIMAGTAQKLYPVLKD